MARRKPRFDITVTTTVLAGQRPALRAVEGEDGEDLVAVDVAAVAVDGDAAVGVAVEGEAEVGAAGRRRPGGGRRVSWRRTRR